MPVERCAKDGKSGHRWGSSGKCYTGPGSRKKALRQGRAIEANKGKAHADNCPCENCMELGLYERELLANGETDELDNPERYAE